MALATSVSAAPRAPRMLAGTLPLLAARANAGSTCRSTTYAACLTSSR